MNSIKNIKEYKILQSVSLVYIAIPTIIFIIGWIKPVYSIPLTALIVVGLINSIRNGMYCEFFEKESKPLQKLAHDLKEPISKIKKSKDSKSYVKSLPGNKRQTENNKNSIFLFIDKPVVFYSLTLFLVIISVLYSGVGGFSIQDGDYIKHNGFFLDLTNYSWPLAYEKTGLDDAPRILNTYIAYYLPSALIGKIFGFSFGYFFSFVWVCLGLFITLLWISRFMSKRSVIFLILFMFFGELAYLGWSIYFPNASIYGLNYNYANWLAYYSTQSPILKGVFWILGSNHTFLTNGPHHIFPSWICIMMIFHDSVFRKSLDRTLFIFAFVPYVSAFMAVGLSPFILLATIQNKFKKIFTIQNILIAPLLLILAALFLISNNALFEKGWIWNFINMKDAWFYIFQFFLLSFGLYFILIPKRASSFPDRYMLPWLYTSVACIVLFSFYRIGFYMDFPIKAYNPSWIIFQICIIASISFAKSFLDKFRVSVLILLLLVASVGAFSNFKYAGKNKLFSHAILEKNIYHINKIGPLDKSLLLFSDGKTFFWKSLAKKPIFTKN